MVWAVAGPTSSTAWAATKIVGDLDMAAPDAVELPFVDVFLMPVQLSPDSIQTGIPCGMADMCGQDPCLCGSVDAYGACACNGVHATYPTLDVSSSDESVVRVIRLFDRVYLVPVGSGTAVVSMHASLIHYNDASASMQVTVDAFSVFDALKIILLVLAVIAIVLAIAWAVRILVRAAVRFKGFVIHRAAKSSARKKERMERK
jgi:hypothetical protein